MTPIRLLFALAPLALLGACGGQSLSNPEDEQGGEGGTTAGEGGSNSGGRSGNGSAGKGSSGTGNGGTGTAGTGQAGAFASGGTGIAGTGTAGTVSVGGSGVCCTAAPVCAPGERQVSGPEDCALGGVCHSATTCCSTIWCTSDVAQCNAVPVCDEGDTQIMGECPPDNSCYTRTLCGSTIWCHDTACDPTTEYNRDYWVGACGSGTGSDAAIAACPPQTATFVNACGCGCEQSADCPQQLDCINLQSAEDEAPPPEAPARPGTGGAQGGVPFPGGAGGTGGTGSMPGASLPVCTAEELARCPFSATF